MVVRYLDMTTTMNASPPGDEFNNKMHLPFSYDMKGANHSNELNTKNIGAKPLRYIRVSNITANHTMIHLSY